MEFSSSYSTFFTTLDTIFDTRLTLLNILHPRYMEKLLDNGGYVNRLMDSFMVDDVKLGYETYLPHYERRHKGILRYSGITFIPFVICSEINRHQYNNFNGDCFKPWHIHVNTYPYILTEDEKNNVKNVFGEFLTDTTNVTFHYLKKEEVSDEFLSTFEIEVMIDYHGFDWLTTILYENGVNYLKRRISLCIPKILNTNGITIYQMTDDFFKTMEASFQTYAEVSFLESYAFSDRILSSKNKKKEE